MAETHVPGLLRPHEHDPLVFDERGRPIIEVRERPGDPEDDVPYEEAMATAARLAACWNHCDGVPTHIITMGPHPNLRRQIEDAGELAAALRAEADDLRRQRDELARALRNLLRETDNGTQQCAQQFADSAHGALARCT